MSKPNYIRLIVKSWRQVLLLTLLGLVFALSFSLVQPLRYSSSIKLLITQTNPTGLDPYTAIKSTERIGQNLAELIYTTAFFDAVTASEDVNASYFPTDEIDKRKLWQETIATNISPGTGIMELIAYHPNRDQATALAVETAKELAIQAPNYFGFSVRVQVIDAPLPSRFFAKPNFMVNGLFGAIIGFLVGLLWVLSKIRD